MTEKGRKMTVFATTAMAAVMLMVTAATTHCEAASVADRALRMEKCAEKYISRTAEPPLEQIEDTIEGSSRYRMVDLGTFTATAYCKCRKCCGKWADVPGTYTGAEPREGVTIAVDPKVIPLGSTVLVTMPDGTVHEYIAQDIGGAIKGHKIDVYHATHKAALTFGRQTVQVRYMPQEVERKIGESYKKENDQ